MVDGLSASQQTEILKSFGRVEQLTKRSIYAPITIRADKHAVGSGVFRKYSYYCVAYGTLDQLTDQNLLASVFSSEQDSESRTEELGQLGDDNLSFAAQTLLKKIVLESVLQSNQLRTEQSLLACSRSLLTSPDGSRTSLWASVKTPADRKPYDGLGILAKATSLESQAGAVFIETHLIFFEPQEWFRGKNLLGAKLPPAIQNQVRSLRRALAK